MNSCRHKTNPPVGMPTFKGKGAAVLRPYKIKRTGKIHRTKIV